jgi:hypothetical protein
MRFRVIFARESAPRRIAIRPHEADGDMPNDPTIRAPFTNPKPKARFEGSQ